MHLLRTFSNQPESHTIVMRARTTSREVCVQTLGTTGRFVSDAACGILYTFSIAIGLGIVPAHTHHLLPMALATVAGLIIAGALCPPSQDTGSDDAKVAETSRWRSPAVLGKALKVPGFAFLAGLIYCAIGAATAAEVANFEILTLEGNNVRWQKPSDGQGPVISYSIVSDTAEFVGARNCRKLTTLDELAAASQLLKAMVREEIAAAFAMWESVANLTFRETPDSSKANILIGAQMEPEGWAFADVFYDALSSERLKPISKALICLNPTKRWKIGFDGDLKTYDLRYTIAHEIGHAIGLDHPSGAGQLMDYHYAERFRQLQPGDVQGALQLYGDRQPVTVMAKAAPRPHDVRSSAARRYAKRWGTRAFPAPSQ